MTVWRGFREARSFVEILRRHASEHPARRAFLFLEGGETASAWLTYGELDLRARQIAAYLQAHTRRGDRALLLYPSGLEFISAFMGCLYAGVVAVPAYAPRPTRPPTRLQAIAADCGPALALTLASSLASLEQQARKAEGLDRLKWLATDRLADSSLADTSSADTNPHQNNGNQTSPNQTDLNQTKRNGTKPDGLEMARPQTDSRAWIDPAAEPGTLAFLQYTSGSTGNPKGVMVTHGNLLANTEMIWQGFGSSESDTFVSWLPLFHDMGLIGCTLYPLRFAFPTVLMDPASFMQRPERWLKAISSYRATVSGSPNSGYELCAAKLSEEQKERLDLSSWRVAFNGAEPVQPRTLDRFAAAFKTCGFRPEAHYPCYGLAEATLLVTGSDPFAAATVGSFDTNALQQGRAVTPAAGDALRPLASSGREQAGCRVVIADPQSGVRLGEGQIGEIWVAGPHIARGYWNREEETARTFQARLTRQELAGQDLAGQDPAGYDRPREEAAGDGPFLRTGDVGFLEHGNLFVSGRSKDLIILRGRNHYPQDIERTVSDSHPALTAGAAAACGVEIDGEERLVAVCEVSREYSRKLADPGGGEAVQEEVTGAIRRAVVEAHEADPYAILLLKPASIPRTSSGKLQRHRCREAFLSGEGLAVAARWQADSKAATDILPRANGATQNHAASLSACDRAGLPTAGSPEQTAIRHWLIETIAARVRTSPGQIRTGEPFSRYGLDSADAVALTGELEDRLAEQLRDAPAESRGSGTSRGSRKGTDEASRVRIPPTLLYDYPTIDQVSQYVAEYVAKHAGRHSSGEALLEPAQTEAQARAETQPQASIAIVGMSCRLPGASNPDEFWRLLSEGRGAVRPDLGKRLRKLGWGAPGRDEPKDVQTNNHLPNDQADSAQPPPTDWAGLLDGIEDFDVAGFDADFFSITRREAEQMDPQQRLSLELAWEALEDAAIAPGSLAGSRTGVFTGISNADYARLAGNDPAHMEAYAATGNALSIAANRISYLFDLRGPSVAVDTACSSSLVAVHQAVQSLRSGDSDVALAGGVSLILAPHLSVMFERAGMLSPEGRCNSFDADASGYVRGEGGGLVVLKRLEDAQRDGDPVLAVIRGSAVNQDGLTNGLTAPNGLSQRAVIREALSRAGVAPDRIGYVEAHGTGTPLGDAMELDSLRAVFGTGESGDNSPRGGAPWWTGSVKANIGHLEAAAGMAGLIKTVLVLRHGAIPPQRNFTSLNRQGESGGAGVRIAARLEPWAHGSGRRLAGVSSFGFGGTNAHVVLEEGPAAATQLAGRPIVHEGGAPPAGEATEPAHLFALSAKTPAALVQLQQRYSSYLAAEPDIRLSDLAYTMARGRQHHASGAPGFSGAGARLAWSVHSLAELREKLKEAFPNHPQTASQDQPRRASQPMGAPRIAFLYTGQGSQYAGMGRELYASEPIFRGVIDGCARILAPLREVSLHDILFAPAQSRSPLNDTGYTQPALFALEMALTRLWESWGIRPSVVAGHSVGEYAAACTAGVFDLEDGMRLIAERARLMQSLPTEGARRGAMVAVFANQERVADALRDYAERVSIAAVNGPRNVVISGEAGAVGEVTAALQRDGIGAAPLNVSHAFHSPLMDPVLERFEQAAGSVAFHPAAIPLVSNLSGSIAGAEIATAAYWRDHIRSPVLFAQAVQAALAGVGVDGVDTGVDAVIEIGPKPVLLEMARRSLRESAKEGAANVENTTAGILWAPSLDPRRGERATLLEALGNLYVRGSEIDWQRVEPAAGRRRLSGLPSYPFERKRYWREAPARAPRESNPRADQDEAAAPVSSELGRRVETPAHLAGTFLWQSQRKPATRSATRQPSSLIEPSYSMWVKLALLAATEATGQGNHEVSQLRLERPEDRPGNPPGKQGRTQQGHAPETSGAELQTVLTRQTGGEFLFQAFERSGPEEPRWTLRASASVSSGNRIEVGRGKAAPPGNPTGVTDGRGAGLEVVTEAGMEAGMEAGKR